MCSDAASVAAMRPSQYAPMPPVFGPVIAVVDGFVILGGFEREAVRAVASTMKLTSSPRQEFFDHQLAVPESRMAASASAAVVRDDHAFAGGQPVGLDHHRKVEIDRSASVRFAATRDAVRTRRGNAGASMNSFAIDLAAFQLRLRRGGPDDRQSAARN